MSQLSVMEAIAVYNKLSEKDRSQAMFVISGAYDQKTAQKEIDRKRSALKVATLGEAKILELPPIVDTLSEVEQVVVLAQKYAAKEIRVVAERDHIGRAMAILKWVIFSQDLRSGMRIEQVPEMFTCDRFEPTFEPHPTHPWLGRIKGWRAAHRWPWWVWNKLTRFQFWFMYELWVG